MKIIDVEQNNRERFPNNIMLLLLLLLLLEIVAL